MLRIISHWFRFGDLVNVLVIEFLWLYGVIRTLCCKFFGLGFDDVFWCRPGRM